MIVHRDGHGLQLEPAALNFKLAFPANFFCIHWQLEPPAAVVTVTGTVTALRAIFRTRRPGKPTGTVSARASQRVD